MDDSTVIPCRKCGKRNLKIYEDGSGFCLECNDAFANIHKYNDDMKEPPHDFFNSDHTIKINTPSVNKQKDSQQYLMILSVLNFISGLGFFIIGAWHLIISRISDVFPSHIITLFICGALFVISGLSVMDNGFKRAFYSLIFIFISLLLQGLYYIYNGYFDAKFDSFCLCSTIFLLFIIILAFILLRMDKEVKK